MYLETDYMVQKLLEWNPGWEKSKLDILNRDQVCAVYHKELRKTLRHLLLKCGVNLTEYGYKEVSA